MNKNAYFNRFILNTLNIGSNRVDWDDSMHICFCVDKNYIKYAGVILVSFINNHSSSNVVFHIFVDEIVDRDIKFLENYISEYKNIEVKIYFVNHEEIINFPQVAGTWNLSIYYRVIAPQVLYGKIDKILYMDVDICIVGNIKEIFEIPFYDNIALVVEDFALESKEVHTKNIGCSNFNYFNSGVMLININKFYENKILKKFIDIINFNSDNFLYYDQDALNILIGDKVKYIDKKYNYQEIDLNYNDVKVIHFAGIRKPWFMFYNYFYFDKWRYFMVKSPWRSTIEGNSQVIKYTFFRDEAKYYFKQKRYYNALCSRVKYYKYKIVYAICKHILKK